MYVNKSFNIKDFPFHECRDLGSEALVAWTADHNIKMYNSWMLPQIVAHYGTWKVDPKDPKSTLKRNMSSDWEIGLWKVVIQPSRGVIVRKQSDPVLAQYSALTPLILYGIRQAQGIPYSAWSLDGLEHLVGSDLYEAMTCTVPELDREELIRIRDTGLIIKSGSKAGQSQNPVSAWKLTGILNTPLAGLNRLAISMILQTWVAHPSIRHSAMILNPSDWDNMPEPLTDSKVLVEEPTKPINDLPWL